MEKLFYPRSVAVVGASPNIGGGKIPYYHIIQSLGYAGALYPVNPSYKEIAGVRVYASLEEIPGDVDLAIVSVPARLAPEVLESAARKGVRFVQFFTSGFSEAGNEELDQMMLQAARSGNTRIVGPNCIGIHCTESRISFDPNVKQQGTGRAAFLGQSGGMTSNFVRLAQARSIPVNKAVSYGNQIDITVEEYLEYLSGDRGVSVVSAYIEDIKNGPRFLAALKKCSMEKPVIILKGGATAEGAVAASSHTGALAGDHEIWSAAMRQCRCIEVKTFEHLIDTVMIATTDRMPAGRRIGFLGAGGGTSVLFADYANGLGFSLPGLEEKTRDMINEKIRNVNTSTANPVDLGAYGFDFNIMAHTMRALARDGNVDIIVPYFSVDFISWFQMDQIESGPRVIIEAMKDIEKPVIPILSKFSEDDIRIEESRLRIFGQFREAGMPVYGTLQDALHATDHFLQWAARR